MCARHHPPPRGSGSTYDGGSDPPVAAAGKDSILGPMAWWASITAPYGQIGHGRTGHAALQWADTCKEGTEKGCRGRGLCASHPVVWPVLATIGGAARPRPRHALAHRSSPGTQVSTIVQTRCTWRQVWERKGSARGVTGGQWQGAITCAHPVRPLQIPLRLGRRLPSCPPAQTKSCEQHCE